MDIDVKKEYMISLISKGLSYDRALDTVYASEEERAEIEADNLFQDTISQIRIDLVIKNLESYNTKVLFGNAQDEHKRILSTMPEVFSTEASKSDAPSLMLTINKVRVEKEV